MHVPDSNFPAWILQGKTKLFRHLKPVWKGPDLHVKWASPLAKKTPRISDMSANVSCQRISRQHHRLVHFCHMIVNFQNIFSCESALHAASQLVSLSSWNRECCILLSVHCYSFGQMCRVIKGKRVNVNKIWNDFRKLVGQKDKIVNWSYRPIHTMHSVVFIELEGTRRLSKPSHSHIVRQELPPAICHKEQSRCRQKQACK